MGGECSHHFDSPALPYFLPERLTNNMDIVDNNSFFTTSYIFMTVSVADPDLEVMWGPALKQFCFCSFTVLVDLVQK